jgi:hypothetical protein
VNNSSEGAHSSRNGDIVMKNGLMRIFWPTDAPTSSEPGVVVGWRNSDLDVLVVAILQHVEVRIATLVKSLSLLPLENAKLAFISRSFYLLR